MRSMFASLQFVHHDMTDYLDLYLIHSAPSGTEGRLDTWRGLLEAKKAGMVRSVGVSN